MSSAIKRINAGNIDGRARSHRYIQKQLTGLHDALVANASELKVAIRSDSHGSAAETEVEFYCAVDVVKEQYSQIDFEKALKDEYSVARSEDFEDRRIAAGIVYIVPSTHTLLFSVISPLSAAIAAGNCVVIELENSLSETASLLRRLLAKSLDSDTVAVVDSRPDESFLSNCVVVQGREESQSTPASTLLVSPTSARVVALVDRTADHEEAAKAIVRARTAFSGKSPYAPDLVLVNEFMLEQFTNAVITHFTKHLSASVSMNGHAIGGLNGSVTKPKRKDQKSALSEKDLNEDGVNVVLSGGKGSVISVTDRNSNLLTRKLNEPSLVIHSISSLDDAIDFANASTEPFLATYHFAAPSVAKYTSQFISSRIHYINHIPTTLLLGPAAPASHPASAHTRYTSSMFSLPCPTLSTPPASSQLLENALFESSSKTRTSDEAVTELKQKVTESLKPTGQRPGKAVGFFDQGLLTGVTIALTPVVAGLGVGVFYGIRAAIRRWR